MNTRFSMLVALLVLGGAAAARAESEGNGDPFAFRSGAQVASGEPFVSDTAQTVYPQSNGTTALPSSLAALVPAYGAEAVLHTGNALPPHAAEGTVAYAQSRAMERAEASRVRQAMVRRVRG